MEFDKQQSQENQTEFNSAIASLMRINEVKKYLDVANYKGDYDLKLRCLKTYFFELVSVFKTKDDIDQRNKFKFVRSTYSQWKSKNPNSPTPAYIIDMLDDWEIELRNLEQSYGMNMMKKSDPRFAMAAR